MDAIVMPNPDIVFDSDDCLLATVSFAYNVRLETPDGVTEMRFIFPFLSEAECAEGCKAFTEFLSTPIGQWLLTGLLMEWALAYPQRIIDDRDIGTLSAN